MRRGTLVGPDTAANVAGVVPVAPTELLRQTNAQRKSAGLPPLTLDEYALARALRSEHGSSSQEVRTWVAWAIRNSAGGADKIFTKLTTKSGSSSSGYFAKQIADSRYAATNQPPYESDVAIAVAVLRAPSSADPTRGATNFFSPKLQNDLFAKAQAGDPKYAKIKSDAAEIRRRWAADGLISRGAPTTALPGEVEFFGRKTGIA